MNHISNYPQKTYEHPVVAVDVVVFTLIKNELNVLLLELSEEPFSGIWALPGGLVTNNETLEESAHRHLATKASIKNAYIEQLYTFGNPKRDPKGWVVSVAYMALLPEQIEDLKTIERYKSIAWHPVKSLPSLAYDHPEIIKMGVKRLQGKLSYTNIVYTLLPEEFTLTELQEVYESILGHELDKRNFRKKIDSLDLVIKLDKKTKGGAHRPASLYRFKKMTPQEVEIL